MKYRWETKPSLNPLGAEELSHFTSLHFTNQIKYRIFCTIRRGFHTRVAGSVLHKGGELINVFDI